MRRLLQRLSVGLAIACVSAGCLPARSPSAGTPGEGQVFVYNGAHGSISIDTRNHALSVDGKTFAYQDCSDAVSFCLISPDAGINMIFPRDCSKNIVPQVAETRGFYMINMFPDSSPTDGTYVSRISDRYAYVYLRERGLVGIFHDESGTIRITPETTKNGMTVPLLKPLEHRIVGDRGLFRCH